MLRNKGSEIRVELIQILSESKSKQKVYDKLRTFFIKYKNDGVVQMMLLVLENKFVNYCSQQKVLELRKRNQILKMNSLHFKDKEPVSIHKEVVVEGGGSNNTDSVDFIENDCLPTNKMDKELDFLLRIMKHIEDIQYQKKRLLEAYRIL